VRLISSRNGQITSNRALADAAEVERPVVFDGIGDFGVAIGRTVLQVVDDSSVQVESKYEAIALRRGLQRLGESRYDLSQEWMGQKFIQDFVAWGNQSEPKFVFAV